MPNARAYCECGARSSSLPLPRFDELCEARQQAMALDGDYEIVEVDDAARMICVCGADGGAILWYCGDCLEKMNR